MKPIYPTDNSNRNTASTDKSAPSTKDQFGKDKEKQAQRHNLNQKKDLGGMHKDNSRQSPSAKNNTPAWGNPTPGTGTQKGRQ